MGNFLGSHQLRSFDQERKGGTYGEKRPREVWASKIKKKKKKKKKKNHIVGDKSPVSHAREQRGNQF